MAVPVPPFWTLGIDLSERYSGAVLLNPDRGVAGQWWGDFGSSDGVHHSVLVHNCRAWISVILQTSTDRSWWEEREGLRVAIEDIGAGVMNPKPAMTLRGTVLGEIDRRSAPGSNLPHIIPSGTWQKAIGFKQDGGGKTSSARKAYYKDWAVCHGLEPALEGVTKVTPKQREDLCAAFCIAYVATTLPPVLSPSASVVTAVKG